MINEGEIYAIENLCPHMDLPLDIGQITEKATILCPYHKSEFCFKSGDVKKWVGKRPQEHQDECKPARSKLLILDTETLDGYKCSQLKKVNHIVNQLTIQNKKAIENISTRMDKLTMDLKLMISATKNANSCNLKQKDHETPLYPI